MTFFTILVAQSIHWWMGVPSHQKLLPISFQRQQDQAYSMFLLWLQRFSAIDFTTVRTRTNILHQCCWRESWKKIYKKEDHDALLKDKYHSSLVTQQHTMQTIGKYLWTEVKRFIGIWHSWYYWPIQKLFSRKLVCWDD